MKTKNILLYAVLLLLSHGTLSQNSLYREIQNMKEAKVTFQKIATIYASEKNDRLTEKFKNKEAISFFKYESMHARNLSKGLSLQIPTSIKENVILLLKEVENNHNYLVTTEKGYAYEPNMNIKHYRGVVQDNPNSVVAITFFWR